MGMGELELEILEHTKEIWVKYKQLPVLHQADLPELNILIHSIQNMVFARKGYSDYLKDQEQKKSNE